MALHTSFFENLEPRTGVVLVVFGSIPDGGAVIERSTSASGSYSQVAVMPVVSPAGEAFVDELPLDGNTYWYKAYQTSPGYDTGSYTAAVHAIPVVIPDVDLSLKPWLQESTINLQLLMDVESETTSSMIVSASLNQDPADRGTPIVSVLSYKGLPSAPTALGSNRWSVQKPPSGSGLVTFKNTMPGRIMDTDSVFIPRVDLSAQNFLSLVMQQTAQDSGSVTVQALANDPLSGSMTVTLQSSQNIPSSSYQGSNTWKLFRPSNNEGTVVFRVNSTSANSVPDYDTFTVASPASSSLPPIQMLTRITSTGTTSLTLGVRFVDGRSTTTEVSGVTLGYDLGAAPYGLSFASAGSQTYLGMTEYLYSVGRPYYGYGQGRVTLTATKSGWLADGDAVEVPEQVTGLARLRTVVTVTASTDDDVTVSVSCTDPLGVVSPAISYAIEPAASVTVTSLGGGSYNITRPSSGASRVTFTGTGSGRTPDSDAVDVVARDVGPTLQLAVTPGPSSYSIAYTSNGTVTYSVDGGGYSTPGSNPVVASVDSTDHTYAFKATLRGMVKDAVITVPKAGSGGGTTSYSMLAPDMTINAPQNKFTVTWGTASPAVPSGTTYTIWWRDDASNTSWSSISGFSGTSGDISSAYHGYSTVFSGTGANLQFYIAIMNSGTLIGSSPATLQPFGYS